MRGVNNKMRPSDIEIVIELYRADRTHLRLSPIGHYHVGFTKEKGRCILITRIHTHCGDRFMSKGREILLGVLPSDMIEYISLMCAENQIVSYCYLTD